MSGPGAGAPTGGLEVRTLNPRVVGLAPLHLHLHAGVGVCGAKNLNPKP